MQASINRLFRPGYLAGLTLMTASFGIHAETIDVGQTYYSRLMKNSSSVSSLMQKGQVDTAKWKLAGVRLSNVKMNPLDKRLSIPAGAMTYITGTKIINCAAAPTSRQVSLNETVTNTTSVTKSETFGGSVSATVSGSYLGVEASGTAEARYDYTKSETAERSTSISLSDTYSVGFDGKGGIYSIMMASKVAANNIPYSVDFRPAPDSVFEFVLHPVRPGSACMYEHSKFKGEKICGQAPSENAFVGSKWNDKISSVQVTGDAVLQLFEHAHFRGYVDTYSGNAEKVAHNDKYSSYRILPSERTVSMKWSEVQPLLPKDLQIITLTGTVSVNKTNPQDAQIINYEMTEDEVRQACAVRPQQSAQSAGGQQSQSVRSVPPGGSGGKSPGEAGGKVSKAEFDNMTKSGKLKVLSKKAVNPG